MKQKEREKERKERVNYFDPFLRGLTLRNELVYELVVRHFHHQEPLEMFLYEVGFRNYHVRIPRFQYLFLFLTQVQDLFCVNVDRGVSCKVGGQFAGSEGGGIGWKVWFGDLRGRF